MSSIRMPSSPWAKGSHRSRHLTNCPSSFSSVSNAIPAQLALTARKVSAPLLCQWASLRRTSFLPIGENGRPWAPPLPLRACSLVPLARIKNRTFRLRTIYSKLIVSVACIGFETRDEMMFEGVPACATLIKRSSFLDTRRTSRAEIATAIARTHYAAVTVPRALACALCVASRGSKQRHEQFAPYPGQFAVGLTLIASRRTRAQARV